MVLFSTGWNIHQGSMLFWPKEYTKPGKRPAHVHITCHATFQAKYARLRWPGFELGISYLVCTLLIISPTIVKTCMNFLIFIAAIENTIVRTCMNFLYLQYKRTNNLFCFVCCRGQFVPLWKHVVWGWRRSKIKGNGVSVEETNTPKANGRSM